MQSRMMGFTDTCLHMKEKAREFISKLKDLTFRGSLHMEVIN